MRTRLHKFTSFTSTHVMKAKAVTSARHPGKEKYTSFIDLDMLKYTKPKILKETSKST